MPGTHLLPSNLLKLFAPRPPVPYARPLGKDPAKVTSKHVSGVAHILEMLKDEVVAAGAAPVVEDEDMEEGEEPVFTHAEETKRQLLREEKKKNKHDLFKTAKETYKPADDQEIVGDPYKTLFISRLSKQATDTDLRREFERYGSVERVRIVRDKRGKSCGYAFIVYERERDMKAAYKESDGLLIQGKRILVDVERGRTVRGWKPRRLGGGLGGRPKKVVEPPPFSGGGGGGGGRGGGGGFRGGGFGGGRGGGFGDRGGGFRGGRGGGGFRGRGGGFQGGGFDGPPSGYGGDRGYGDRGGFRGGGGGFRGGRDDGFRYASTRSRNHSNTQPFSRGGRGGGIGYQGGGFGGGGPGGPPGGGYGPPGGNGGGGFGGPPGGGFGPPGGGYRNDLKREGPGGYDDRDAKRMRY
ncbi:U1 snRNP 70K protein [Flagelloscypha sp. PMI_526]|nr:U1 snRNP 70K protein [Flagelloscypha sp. PMI_526]